VYHKNSEKENKKLSFIVEQRAFEINSPTLAVISYAHVLSLNLFNPVCLIPV